MHPPGTHVTYSLSVLVVRVSGALPNRPMRMSFARSDADGRDDENACGLWDVREGRGNETLTYTRPNAYGNRRTREEHHFSGRGRRG